MTTETPAQQRDRIIRENLHYPDFRISDYDDALALGYQPESWDGMWKLRARNPIIWLTRRTALCAEAVGITRRGRQRIRYRLRRTEG